MSDLQLILPGGFNCFHTQSQATILKNAGFSGFGLIQEIMMLGQTDANL